MTKMPEIRIMFSEILFDSVSTELAKTRPDNSTASKEQCLEWTTAYQEAWKPKATTILSGMCDLFGQEFYSNLIDVNLAPWIKPMSKPILMSFSNEPDQFVDLLTHELLHVLQTDNTKVKYDEDKLEEIRKIWIELFSEKYSFETLVHIPVHAGLKAIYLDVLEEPYRLERDIETCKQWPDYAAAWEYVEQNDYIKIISDLKSAYAHL